MLSPEELRPGKTREELTAEAAQQFASLAERLRSRGHEPQAVAHFLNKLLFCMFAEDAGLLPTGLIDRLADAARDTADVFTAGLSDLFGKMSSAGGLFGAERIDWFNGGLFDGPDALALDDLEVRLVQSVSARSRDAGSRRRERLPIHANNDLRNLPPAQSSGRATPRSRSGCQSARRSPARLARPAGSR